MNLQADRKATAPIQLVMCRACTAAPCKGGDVTVRKRSFPANKHSTASVALLRGMPCFSNLTLSETTSPPSVIRNLTFLFVFCFVGGRWVCPAGGSAASVLSGSDSEPLSCAMILGGQCFPLSNCILASSTSAWCLLLAICFENNGESPASQKSTRWKDAFNRELILISSCLSCYLKRA